MVLIARRESRRRRCRSARHGAVAKPPLAVGIGASDFLPAVRRRVEGLDYVEVRLAAADRVDLAAGLTTDSAPVRSEGRARFVCHSPVAGS